MYMREQQLAPWHESILGRLCRKTSITLRCGHALSVAEQGVLPPVKIDMGAPIGVVEINLRAKLSPM